MSKSSEFDKITDETKQNYDGDDTESITSEVGSTTSSILPFHASKGNEENFTTKYSFAFAKARKSEEDFEDAEELVGKVAGDVEEDETTKLVFEDKAHNPQSAEGSGDLVAAAVNAASRSTNGDELMENIENELNNFLQIFSQIEAQNGSYGVLTEINSAIEQFKKKKAEFGKLSAVINSPEYVLESSLRSELNVILSDEQLMESSQVFEKIRQIIKQNIKGFEQEEERVARDVAKAMKARENPEMTEEESSRNSIIKENALLSQVLARKAIKEKKELTSRYNQKFISLPIRAGSESRYHDDTETLNQDNKNLRQLALEKLADGNIKRFIENNPSPCTVYDNLRAISPQSDPSQLYNILSDPEQDLEIIDIDASNSRISQLQEYQLRLQSLLPLPSQKYSSPSYITYNLDENLLSKYVVRTDKRPDSYHGSSQKDHVTAYVALATSFVNSILPVGRARDLAGDLQERLNLVFDESNEEKLNITTHSVNDEERRNKIKTLPENMGEAEKFQINKLIKTRDLRLVNKDICAVANEFLIKINAENFGTFQRAAAEESKDKSGYVRPSNEGGAIDYIAKLNNIYSTANLKKVIGKQIAELQVEEETSGKNKYPAKLNNLRKLSQHLEDNMQMHLRKQPEIPEISYEAGEIVVNDYPTLVKNFSEHFFNIFDLDFKALKSHDAVQYTAPKVKNELMRDITSQLIKRHFRVFGVLAGNAVDGMSKASDSSENLPLDLSMRFLDKFFQQIPFEKLFSEDLDKDKKIDLSELSQILSLRAYEAGVSCDYSRERTTSGKYDDYRLDDSFDLGQEEDEGFRNLGEIKLDLIEEDCRESEKEGEVLPAKGMSPRLAEPITPKSSEQIPDK